MESDRPGKVYVAFCSPTNLFTRRRRIGAWLTRALTGSNLTHVAVSNGGAVLSMSFEGRRYYPHDAYLALYPTIEHVIELDAPAKPDLDEYGQNRPLSICRSLLKHFSRGLIPAMDCVSVASDVLRDAGVDIPRSVTSPASLHRHLLQQTEDKHARDSRTVARSHRHARRHLQAPHRGS